MFTATVKIDRTVLTAVVGDPAADANPEAVGIVTGSLDLLERLRFHTGERFSATPTGPVAELDPTDERSVLIALMSLGRVLTTEGDVPQIVPAEDQSANPNVVY